MQPSPRSAPGNLLLDHLRGERVTFDLRSPPTFPTGLREIEDPLLRENAREAWVLASRMYLLINFWELFLTACQLGTSLADENQVEIQGIFPGLATMQICLDHLACLPVSDQPCHQPTKPFPAQEFMALIQTIPSLIVKQVMGLLAMGINSAALSSDDPPWKRITSPLDGPIDFTCNPPIVRLKSHLQAELVQLRSEAMRLMDLLETAPAATLNVPKRDPIPAPQETGCATEPANVFRFCGTDWTVRYQSGQYFLLPESLGALSIALLLENPHKQFGVSELRQCYIRFRKVPGNFTSLHAGADDGDRALDAGLESEAADLGDVIDKVGAAAVYRKVQELVEELERATHAGDQVAAELLVKQQARLKDCLATLYRPDGRPHKLRQRIKRDRDAVCVAIKRLLVKIRIKSIAFYRHLRNSLKYSYLCSYEPDSPALWNE